MTNERKPRMYTEKEVIRIAGALGDLINMAARKASGIGEWSEDSTWCDDFMNMCVKYHRGGLQDIPANIRENLIRYLEDRCHAHLTLGFPINEIFDERKLFERHQKYL